MASVLVWPLRYQAHHGDAISTLRGQQLGEPGDLWRRAQQGDAAPARARPLGMAVPQQVGAAGEDEVEQIKVPIEQARQATIGEIEQACIHERCHGDGASHSLELPDYVARLRRVVDMGDGQSNRPDGDGQEHHGRV